MNFSSYIRGAALVAVLLGALIYGLKALVWQELPVWIAFLPLFLLLLFAVSFRWLARTEAVNPKRFVGVFMAATAMKMFAVVIGMVIYLMLDGPMRMHVSLIMIGAYMAMMAHFAGVASSQIRRSSEK